MCHTWQETLPEFSAWVCGREERSGSPSPDADSRYEYPLTPAGPLHLIVWLCSPAVGLHEILNLSEALIYI